LSFSKSVYEYIPLVANAPELIYFHDGLVEGFIMVDGNVSTGLGIILYYESPKKYMVGAKELQVIFRGVLIYAFAHMGGGGGSENMFQFLVLLEAARNIL